MQGLEVSGAVRRMYGSLGVKRISKVARAETNKLLYRHPM